MLLASQQAAAFDLKQELAQQWQQQVQHSRIAQLETYRQKIAALDEAQFTTYKQAKHNQTEHNQAEYNQTEQQLQHKQPFSKKQPAKAPTQALLAQTPQPENCSDWQGVQLFGLDLIKPSYAKALTAQAAQLSQQAKHTCLTPTALQQLSRRVSLAFMQSGYFKTKLKTKLQTKLKTKLTQETLNAQTSPVLQLHFSPAHITAIENNTAFATANLFGSAIGKPANIQDIDQALDQANRLKNHKVSVDVYPQKSGDVVLALADTHKETAAKRTFYGVLSLDNFGDSLTNRLRGQVQLGVANPLGMADNLLFTALSTLPAKDEVNHSVAVFNRSMAVNYQVPYGYWTFTTFGSHSQHQNQVQLTKNRLTQKGNSWQAGVRADKVVSRSSKHIRSVHTSLSHARKKSWFGGAFIGSQSPTVQAISLGLNHTQLTSKGVVSADISYRHGRSAYWLKNKQNKHHFNVYATHLAVQQFFSLPAFSEKDSLNVSSKFTASYADSLLPAGQRETLNNRYGVRGGFDYGVNGDAYVSLQNTVTFTTKKPAATAQLVISPYMGLDIGRAYKKQSQHTATNHFQDVAAYLLGVKAKIHGLEANIYASKAKIGKKSEKTQFTAQEYAQKTQAEDVQLNAVLTWHF